MRDPMTWSLPLGQLFGVVVRVHILFPIVAIGLVLRTVFLKDVQPGLWIETIILLGLLFFSVLLHEFGHVFAARSVDGDASEVLLWPLGGLAMLEVPHTPRANFVAAAGGPVVNVLLAATAVAALAAFSMLPSFKPWGDPYTPVVYSWSEGCHLGSKTGRGDLWKFTGYKQGGIYVTPEKFPENGPPQTADGKPCEVVVVHPDEVMYQPVAGKPAEEQFTVWHDKEQKITAKVSAQPMARGVWIVLLSRFFWVNWFLLLLNLLPAFPLDGGRMLQCFLWWRSDYRQATLVAIFGGFLVMFIVILYALVAYEQILPLCLAVFIYIACRRQWILLETGGEESLFGYDFSQGYTSLERGEAGAPPKRRQSWWQRWMQRRAARRMQRQQEQREAEERRMDELLEKVQRQGLAALTDEERRFLTRVSAKYRNRQ
jgi:Zn-dependent protease